MKRTFTLIELVVVIVILGIIAAILFPIFAQSHEHSKRPQCLSNAKQLGLGLMMYAADYDQHLPPAGKWMTETQLYTKNKAIYVCPVVKTENPKVQASYAMDTRLSGKSLNKLHEPSNRAVIYDSTRPDWDATDPGQTFAPRHNEKGNVAFADGHAKAHTREDFQKQAR
ncbi:prepilin-type N-terminal cleavage/methylation domain-containing protein [Armatimonas sp.]|uniref:prepilin-type N-terminal cleavage/methylation domain-containing protein n=1 Tax=Armatimonas sp. TaxID=1872638 RepID=UPI00286C5F2A|nr:prepilin-type N-terminal cleavage/methylation domain-containing protein [Armatimonas sp.]